MMHVLAGREKDSDKRAINESVGRHANSLFMKIPRISTRLAFVITLAISAASASAAILSVAGNDTLVGNRALNLIVNGSFEADDGVATNGSYWATGTGFSPTMSLTGWTASGQGGSYAIWGNDGFGGIKLSDLLPHGTNGLYFGGGIMAGVSPLPTEANNGVVTFNSTPTITPKPSDGPVTLQQTVSGLNPSATYVLDFWTSGESVGPLGFAVDGFFGLNITGEATRYFAAPSGNGPIGSSQRYQVYFQPAGSTVTFEWINWGHYTDTNGLSDELVLDDVILNLLTNAPVPLDCNCLTNITVTCPGIVPDLCALFAPCFGTNLLPGSCTQSFPPGMQFPVGNYFINLTVQDSQSNYFSCPVPFTVLPPAPVTNLTVACPANKTVECGSGWSFDAPVVLSACCLVNTTFVDTVISNSPCSQIVTRTWDITDGCGNVTNCSQIVTVMDTTPPGTQCHGANLVPNGNFERSTNCPSANSQFDFAAPWFTPTDGTSDYYNSCAGNGSFVTTPTNSVGNQVPLSGQAYAGAVLYSTFGTNPTNSYREYLEVPLLTTLVSGQKYLVSFYVSRAEQFGNAIADIGALLFPAPLVNYGPPSNGFTGVLPFTPQIVNPSTNLITDTTNWTLIQGIYTAIGGESYLILGNFRDDPGTTAVPASGSFVNYAYYYFDDVSVVAICDPLTNKTVQCGDPWMFDEVAPFDNCSGGNVSVTVTTTTNGYCPQILQRDWLLTDPCGNSTNLSQTITIVDTNPPILLCAGGANLAPNPSFESFAFCPWFFSQVPTAAPWFNPTVATPDYFNACTSFPLVSTPNNFPGSQPPLTGQAYVGAFAYSRYGTNPVPGYREYIEAPLLAPLVAGVTYQVSFRVNLADYSGWAIAQIGAHFSIGPVLDGATQGPLNVIPQVENPGANLLTSTNSWMLVQGTFTAVGGENHITLGNFRSDALTTAVLNLGTNSPSPSLVDFAYYYYDDIAVVPLCSFTNKFVPCAAAWEFDTPLAYDECSADYLSVFITSTTVTGTCPKVHTRVWTIYDACLNTLTATQTVTEVDTTPPDSLCSGYNLVPNQGFENLSSCPGAPSYPQNATPWFNPTVGSSDVFNSCATLGSGVSVPVNFIGSQTAFAGNGYGGGYVYVPGNAGTNSMREYLSAPLIAPLLAGQAYAVSFRVSRADSAAYAIAEIGAHFSVGAVSNWPASYLPVIPQIENPATNILVSATNWTLVSGTLIASGGEDHITLGNFRTDANTTAQFVGGSYNYGYYYYDDVKVIALCTNVPFKEVACNAPWTFDPAPLAVDRCSGSNVTVTLAGTVTNSLCPFNATRTWTLADACGNATNWSQTVVVAGGGPLSVNCGCLQDTALGLLSTNGCVGVIPDLSVLTNSPCIVAGCGGVNIVQSPLAGTVVGPGVHYISLTITACGGGGSSFCELPFYVNPPLPVITCPPNLVLLTCTTSAIANFTVTATGNVGPVVCSPPSGTAFPLGTNTVTCTATGSCGGISVCGFNVVVKPPSTKWGCLIFAIGIEVLPLGGSHLTYLATLPGGGIGVNFDNLGSSGQDGVRLLPGNAQQLTFSTELDFSAPDGARLDLQLPPDPGQTTGPRLLSFVRAPAPQSGWNITRSMSPAESSDALYRSIAIGTNGELFSSFTQDAATLGTNILAHLAPMADATNAPMTVTLDCLTRELTLEFPRGTWMPDAARKGWDGCIYGNGPRGGTKTNKTARLILTPLTTVPPPPILAVDLLTSNLTSMAFDNPSITASGRKWGDGHVTLMKAYDDGTERGMEFVSFGEGGGVHTDLGHAASFQFHRHYFENGDIPTQDEVYRIKGWPPGTTTNRPPPPVFNLRLAQSSGGGGAGGSGGVECFADFTEWGVSNVTVQLWDGTTLVGETNHVPASLASALVTLASFPRILGCPGVGVVSLSDTNPITVLGGLECSSGLCVGTELRILAELTPAATPPLAFTGLECLIAAGMDNLIYRLQTTPACSPVPLNVVATAGGVTLGWTGDGFHLQGAESVLGPWYDLEVESPATIPAGSASRVFRLRCD